MLKKNPLENLTPRKSPIGEIYTVSNDEKIKAEKQKPQKSGVTPRKHRLGEIYTVSNDEKIKAEKKVRKKGDDATKTPIR